MMDKDKFCEPECIGEHTGGDLYWCRKCGAVLDDYGKGYELPTGYPEDIDKLYCPKQGRIP